MTCPYDFMADPENWARWHFERELHRIEICRAMETVQIKMKAWQSFGVGLLDHTFVIGVDLAAPGSNSETRCQFFPQLLKPE